MKREKVAEWVEENANIWAVNSKDELIDVITRFASENALNQAKVNNSRLEGVSKPNFVEWMHSKGYWLGHDDRWRGSDILTVDEFLKLRKEHFDL